MKVKAKIDFRNIETDEDVKVDDIIEVSAERAKVLIDAGLVETSVAKKSSK